MPRPIILAVFCAAFVGFSEGNQARARTAPAPGPGDFMSATQQIGDALDAAEHRACPQAKDYPAGTGDADDVRCQVAVDLLEECFNLAIQAGSFRNIAASGNDTYDHLGDQLNRRPGITETDTSGLQIASSDYAKMSPAALMNHVFNTCVGAIDPKVLAP